MQTYPLARGLTAHIMDAVMFLRCSHRKKNGKVHSYWSIVENRRLADGRVVQRHMLYLGEINDAQERAWARSIEVFQDGNPKPQTMMLFPEDQLAATVSDASIVRLRLTELSVHRPRQWGACWLALHLWKQLGLDQFWSQRLAPSRKGTRWDQVLAVLTIYRLLAPGSEWRLHRQWFETSAMADLLGLDGSVADSHTLYSCHDRLLAHKTALFSHLTQRWRDLFNAVFDVLLYDLTSTYLESAPPFGEGDKRQFGYSRDKRPDCVQVVIALIVTPEGLPLAYEVLSGNTSDKTTLRAFLEKIEKQYGKARRIWVMDRGIPTEEVLAEMRASDPPVLYLVGTPKGRLSKLEKELLDKPWRAGRPGGKGQLWPQEGGGERRGGENSAGRAVPAGASGGEGQALGARGRVVRAGLQRGSASQGTGDATATVEAAVETAGPVAADEAVRPGAVDETGGGPPAGAPCLAVGDGRAGAGQHDVQLSTEQGQAPTGASPRRSLPASE